MIEFDPERRAQQRVACTTLAKAWDNPYTGGHEPDAVPMADVMFSLTNRFLSDVYEEELEYLFDRGSVTTGFQSTIKIISELGRAYSSWCRTKSTQPTDEQFKTVLSSSDTIPGVVDPFMALDPERNKTWESSFGTISLSSSASYETLAFRVVEDDEGNLHPKLSGYTLVMNQAELDRRQSFGELRTNPDPMQVCPARGMLIRKIWETASDACSLHPDNGLVSWHVPTSAPDTGRV